MESERDFRASGGMAFNFDAMLMFGWVAGADMKVSAVNHALSDWMRRGSSALQNLEMQISAARRSSELPTIEEFIKLLVSGHERDLGNVVHKALDDVRREIETLVVGPTHLRQTTLLGDSYRMLQVVRSTDKGLLGAVRCVKPGGIQLAGDDLRDRVDLINVCVVEGHEGRWRVVGFQGQLQEAWVRVESTIVSGTKAGAIGLIGRNMSHNLGSHALYWLEQEEHRVEQESCPGLVYYYDGRSGMYRYLRERMEFLAGFATDMPLSPVKLSARSMVEDFSTSRLLLDRLTRSEGVAHINVEYSAEGDPVVALPGGRVGCHALYSLIENAIRDSAKYAKKERSPHLRVLIQVQEPDRPEWSNYLKVTVSDDRSDFKSDSPGISRDLAALRICDEAGLLLREVWGIKERFICACVLRGIRLEQIPLQRTLDSGGSAIDLSLGSYVPDADGAKGGQGIKDPPVLQIANVQGRLGWTFYLMKPLEILVVSDESWQDSSEVTVRDWNWFWEHVDKPAAIRHRFLVAHPRTPDDVTLLASIPEKLPRRVFLWNVPARGANAESEFVPTCLSKQDICSRNLTEQWVRWLLRGRPMPTIVSMDLFDPPRLASEGENLPTLFKWNLDLRQWYTEHGATYKERPLILFDRHSRALKGSVGARSGEWESWNQGPTLLHYETHDSDADAVRFIVDQSSLPSNGDQRLPVLSLSLVEAAVTKVLIVDERLSQVSCETFHESKVPFKVWFAWKGIDIEGKEYASSESLQARDERYKDLLFSWITEGNRRHGFKYDYLLLHRGIADKIRQACGWTFEELCERIKPLVGQLIIHSARGGATSQVPGVKHCSLSNVQSWMAGRHAKLQIVEELALLRNA